jgi:competence protein ComEC
VLLALGATAGALALGHVPFAALLLAGACLLVASVATPAPRRALVLALGVGVFLVGLRGSLEPRVTSPAVALPDGDGPWMGTVVSVGAPREGSRPAIVAIEMPSLTVAATVPWYPVVGPGDHVRLRGSIRRPPEGDYGAYLARVGATGTVRASSLELAPGAPGSLTWFEDSRRAAAAAIERAVPEPEAGLANGILIGLRDRVDRQLAADFTTAGVSHVVAISGWNIAIVATCLGALAGQLGRRRRTVLTAAAIVAYVAFVGPSPSVVRAGAMAGIVLLARDLGRPSRAASAMGLAVTGLLLIDPAWIDDAGFKLSVLATAGLLAWGTAFTVRLAGPDPGRVRSWLAESLGVSFAAQLATTPVILYEFGRLSLVAPLVNLAVVPLVAPAMAAGATALIAGIVVAAGAPAIIAIVGGLPAWGLLVTIVAIVRVGASLPLASVTLSPPWDAVAAITVAAAIVAGVLSRRLANAGATRARAGRVPRATIPASNASRRQPQPLGARFATIALAAAIAALGLAMAHRPDGVARIVVLDVGQGDGILVEGGHGGRMLVDGGPDPGRLLVALDERLPPWDRRIDIVVLTHPHEDHVAGLALLLKRYRVGRVFEPGMLGPGPGYQAWTKALARGPADGVLATGSRLRLDDVALRVLWPDPGVVPRKPADGGTAINNVSIVLLGEVAGHRFLLAGDIEQDIDPILLQRDLPQVEVLKVAHHGSRTSSTDAFLAAVRPGIAIVSAGRGNPYGHPAPATIERLSGIARRTFRTDLDGAVEVRFDADGAHARAAGARPAAASSTAAAGVSAAIASIRNPTGGGSNPLLACGIVRPDTARSPITWEAPALALSESALRRAIDGRPGLGSLPPPEPEPAATLQYHPADDGPLTAGGGVAAPFPRPPELARAALRGRRRDRGVARGSSRAERAARGPRRRRSVRAPPRCRQDPAEGRHFVPGPPR